MKYFLDTNVFLRIILNDNDKQFEDCLDLLKLIKLGKVEAVTSNIVFAEIIWTLERLYKVPKDKCVDYLNYIANVNEIDMVDNFDSNLIIELYSLVSVKYVDCMIASIPQIYKGEWAVISYDKDFDKIGVLRKEPQEILNKIKK